MADTKIRLKSKLTSVETRINLKKVLKLKIDEFSLEQRQESS